MRTCKTHRQYQHTHIIILPSPLWNGAFCTLGCKTQSAHEAVANITLCVGPAFHGETIPLGGGGTPALAKLGTGTYIYTSFDGKGFSR